MKTYYKDITIKGKTVYYRYDNSAHRYFRVKKSDVETEVSFGYAEIDDYIPHKPYEEMTNRQLIAALKKTVDNDNKAGLKLINQEIHKRAEQACNRIQSAMKAELN